MNNNHNNHHSFSLKTNKYNMGLCVMYKPFLMPFIISPSIYLSSSVTLVDRLTPYQQDEWPYGTNTKAKCATPIAIEIVNRTRGLL